MSRVIIFLSFIAAVITAVLFFVNVPVKNGWFYYQAGFTILFQTLLIVWLGLSADYKGLPWAIKMVYFLITLIFGAAEFFLLYLGQNFFHYKRMSSTMTTVLLSSAGIQILVSIVLFAVGNLLFKHEES